MLAAERVTSFSLTPLASAMPPLPTLSGFGDAETTSAVAVGVGVVGLLALTVVVGVFYNKWAYDDWTCMFKNCVQTSTKRR